MARAPRCCTGSAACSQIRRRHPVFGLGDFAVCPADNEAVLAFLRALDRTASTDDAGEAVLCVNNLVQPPAGRRDSAARAAARAASSSTSSAAAASRRSPTGRRHLTLGLA